MKSTSDHLHKFRGGNRIAGLPGVPETCEALDTLSGPDRNSILLSTFSARADEAGPKDIVEGSSLHQPSGVAARDIHQLEGIIFGCLEDAEFVTLSPLQPIGTNAFLADIDQKTVFSSLRGSEVNADITTSLFRIAIARWESNMAEPPTVHLAGNARITRGQAFDQKSNLVPHFSMFGQVTIGKQARAQGTSELEYTASHIVNEIDILRSVASSSGFEVAAMDIEIGNTLLLHGLHEQGIVDIKDIMAARKEDSRCDPFRELNIDLPAHLSLDTPDIGTVLRDVGFTKGTGVIERFKEIMQIRDDISASITLDTARTAGINYYKGMCYKLRMVNAKGASLSVGDGGVTDWAARCGYGKKSFTVTSGLGTEMIARHFAE